MKSDISRQTFQQRKHYSQIIIQQGRVQLDADWNEQQDILAHRIETYNRDMIGPHGVPQDQNGFQLQFTPDHRDLLIFPGRIYVDGTLCELDTSTHVKILSIDKDGKAKVDNIQVDGQTWEKDQWVELLADDQGHGIYVQIIHASSEADSPLRALTFPPAIDLKSLRVNGLRRVTTYMTQPDYPHPLPLPEVTEEPILLLAYLDVWQRHITYLNDPLIREVALGGPETTTRLQTIWQVKLLTLKLTHEQEEKIKARAAKTHEYREQEKTRLQLENVGSTSPGSATRTRLHEIRLLMDKLRGQEEHFISDLCAHSDKHPAEEWNNLLLPSTGKLNVTTSNLDNKGISGYNGLQNELYRIEIHEVAADHSSLTYKWARNNASTVARVEISGETLLLPSSGQGGILNFNQYQFVEVTSNDAELHNQAGKTAQITRVDTLTNQLTLDTSLGSDGQQITIRLWDDIKNIDQQLLHTWLPLDGGINIQFAGGRYHRGDYWLIAARTSTGEVEWPPYEIPNRHPIPQLRQAIQHHYAPLAHILLYQNLITPRNISDCRRRFTPIPTVTEAMHIVGINWYNDAPIARKQLLWNEETPYKGGLQILLDVAPDPESIKAATVIVTLESKQEEKNIILPGHISVQDKTIFWHWETHQNQRWLAIFYEKNKNDDDDEQRNFTNLFTEPKNFARVTIHLKGHTIWGYVNNHAMHLDGQAFGQPGNDPHTARRRTHLAFPSGAEVKASDFESWFYILYK